MAVDVPKVLSKLAELRELDRSLEVFGAEGHRYQANPPLKQADLARFEDKHDVRLPEDYRTFLLEVGNGGAGPAYGVFPLGQMDDGRKLRRWKEGNGFIGDLSAPFPHTRRWNKLPKMPKVKDSHPDFERLLEERDRIYWSTDNVNGAIPICNLGCCLRHWLVITGREAGRIWVDERADEGGLFPLSTTAKRRYNFSEWYDKWLASSLRQARRQHHR